VSYEIAEKAEQPSDGAEISPHRIGFLRARARAPPDIKSAFLTKKFKRAQIYGFWTLTHTCEFLFRRGMFFLVGAHDPLFTFTHTNWHRTRQLIVGRFIMVSQSK
jgi:hypothetical protein